MRLFIPPLGTKLRLLRPWNFRLYCEPRNTRLWDLRYSPPSLMAIPVRFRKLNYRDTYLDIDDTLIVDRVYIRQGQTMFNSVTFKGLVFHAGNYHKVRFWARLSDVNDMDVEVIE